MDNNLDGTKVFHHLETLGTGWPSVGSAWPLLFSHLVYFLLLPILTPGSLAPQSWVHVKNGPEGVNLLPLVGVPGLAPRKGNL